MEESTPIKVMIVDDIDILRRGLSLAIRAFDMMFQLVGEASNGAEALQLRPKIDPDVIIMDLKMPEMDGITATSLIKKESPRTKIIILSSFQDEAQLDAAMKAGASTYLIKNISIDELAQTICQVHLMPHPIASTLP